LNTILSQTSRVDVDSESGVVGVPMPATHVESLSEQQQLALKDLKDTIGNNDRSNKQ